MSTIDARIEELGLVLPEVLPPIAAYAPAVTSGRLVWTSGQVPLDDGKLIARGHVGGEVDLATAHRCARQAALNAIAVVKHHIGDLDRVEQVVKVVVFVSSTTDFTDQALVANGASELLQDVFGTRGVHARSAVGMAGLPLNAPVEVEILVSVTDQTSHV
jgi:enamine deaminase RidA (YjgF/YER057c/UK114 family)